MSPADIATADVTVPRGGIALGRITTIHRIAELMGKYRHGHDTKAGHFFIYEVETGNRSPMQYSDEDSARAGARLAAACDIRALFDAPVRGR